MALNLSFLSNIDSFVQVNTSGAGPLMRDLVLKFPGNKGSVLCARSQVALLPRRHVAEPRGPPAADGAR